VILHTLGIEGFVPPGCERARSRDARRRSANPARDATHTHGSVFPWRSARGDKRSSLIRIRASLKAASALQKQRPGRQKRGNSVVGSSPAGLRKTDRIYSLFKYHSINVTLGASAPQLCHLTV
jgi:hypothetical protein